MDIVVKGRHSTLPMGFREHSEDKLSRLERLDHKVFRLDVEVSRERNPRQAEQCERVELTCYGRGPVVRAEAAAADPYAALDIAISKLEERLRRAHDRRLSRGSRVASAHHADAKAVLSAAEELADAGSVATAQDPPAPDHTANGTARDPGTTSLVVREKEHVAAPESVEEAVHHMELVGHDFYLFSDAASGLPSVVYRRKGYDYGVLRLVPARPGADELPG